MGDDLNGQDVEENECRRLLDCILIIYLFPNQDQERRTPLHAAAYLGDAPVVELLILSGK